MPVSGFRRSAHFLALNPAFADIKDNLSIRLVMRYLKVISAGKKILFRYVFLDYISMLFDISTTSGIVIATEKPPDLFNQKHRNDDLRD